MDSVLAFGLRPLRSGLLQREHDLVEFVRCKTYYVISGHRSPFRGSLILVLAAGLTGVRASGCQPGMTVRRVTAHDHMNAQNDVERRADYGPYNPEGIES